MASLWDTNVFPFQICSIFQNVCMYYVQFVQCIILGEAGPGWIIMRKVNSIFQLWASISKVGAEKSYYLPFVLETVRTETLPLCLQKLIFINEISSLFCIMILLTICMWETDAFQADTWMSNTWQLMDLYKGIEHWLASTPIKGSWALLHRKFLQQIFPSEFSVAWSTGVVHSGIWNSSVEVDPWR